MRFAFLLARFQWRLSILPSSHDGASATRDLLLQGNLVCFCFSPQESLVGSSIGVFFFLQKSLGYKIPKAPNDDPEAEAARVEEQEKIDSGERCLDFRHSHKSSPTLLCFSSQRSR